MKVVAGVIVVAVALLALYARKGATRAGRRSRSDVAGILERHLNGPAPGWEWGDFVDGPALHDPELEAVRRECIEQDYDWLVLPEKRGCPS